MKIIDIKEDEFEEKVLKSDKKVLVDFYATWCGPCKMLSPVIEKISDKDDSYNYYKIDVDSAREISKKYGIMSVPTLLIFEDGEVKNSSLGFLSEDEVKEFLDI